jgi:cold shock protein
MLHKLPAVIATLIALTAVPALADDPKMKVTLLGTAGPEYFPDRLGISTLVEANGELLLFDVGRGTVKWFNSQKGYGFIQPQGGGGKDVFVHISAVERAGLSSLNEGQVIEYEIVENRGKQSAENLKVSR